MTRELSLIRKNNWDKAISLICETVDFVTNGINFIVESKTTNCFDEFKKETEKNGYITVSSEGCYSSIYDNHVLNIRARVWHDLNHLQLNMDFSYEQELVVAKAQTDNIQAYADHKGSYTFDIVELAKKIVIIDIKSQYNYYQKYGKFVTDQKSFVQNILWNETDYGI